MFLFLLSLQQKQLTPQAMIIMSEADTAPTISNSFRLIWQFLPANQELQLHETCSKQHYIMVVVYTNLHTIRIVAAAQDLQHYTMLLPSKSQVIMICFCSVVEPDKNWINSQDLCGSGSPYSEYGSGYTQENIG